MDSDTFRHWANDGTEDSEGKRCENAAAGPEVLVARLPLLELTTLELLRQ